jgi:hypothetical protein
MGAIVATLRKSVVFHIAYALANTYAFYASKEAAVTVQASDT